MRLSVEEIEAKALINILEQLKAIYVRKIPIIVMTEKESIYEFVLERGCIKYSIIERKFRNARDNLIELIKEGKITIRGLDEIGISLENIENFDKIEVEPKIVKSPFFKIFTDKREGKEYAYFIIPRNAMVCAKW